MKNKKIKLNCFFIAFFCVQVSGSSIKYSIIVFESGDYRMIEKLRFQLKIECHSIFYKCPNFLQKHSPLNILQEIKLSFTSTTFQEELSYINSANFEKKQRKSLIVILIRCRSLTLSKNVTSRIIGNYCYQICCREVLGLLRIFLNIFFYFCLFSRQNFLRIE